MKGYEFIAKLWKEYGTSHVFLQDVMFMESLRDFVDDGGQAILAHSEFAAGYMADGYARVTNKPGICCCQSIGSANLASSVQDAWLACSPVLTFTGRQTIGNLYRNAYQEGDHRPFFDGLTKFNATVESASQLPLLMRQSYREATSGKPRPTHLDIFGFCGQECEEDEVGNVEIIANKKYAQYPAVRPAAEEADIALALEAIDKAKKPLILAGRGALVSKAHKELMDFAVRNDIPVATTLDGKTLMVEGSDMWAGVIGNYGMHGTNVAAQACDLFIVIGSQTSNQTTLGQTTPPATVKTIQIDIDPTEIGRNYPNCIPLCGDAKTVLAQLAAGVSARKRPEWRAEVAAYVAKTVEQHEHLWNNSGLGTANGDPITAGYLVKQVSDALPDDGILVSDTGFSAIWTGNLTRLKPSQFYTRAAGTLGWSFPASIGVKAAVGNRPVINYTGDGGMFYFSNEIETAVRYNIPVVSVVNNNYCLSSNIPWMQEVFHDEPRNVGRNSFVASNSFAEIAKNFGAYGVRVENPKDVRGAIEDALASGRPAVVEVVTNGRVTPPCPRTDDLSDIKDLIAYVSK